MDMYQNVPSRFVEIGTFSQNFGSLEFKNFFFFFSSTEKG